MCLEPPKYSVLFRVQEMELQARRDQFRVDELRQQHLLETRQVPKKLKAEHKQVLSELRKGRQRKNAEAFKEEVKRVSTYVSAKSPLWLGGYVFQS